MEKVRLIQKILGQTSPESKDDDITIFKEQMQMIAASYSVGLDDKSQQSRCYNNLLLNLRKLEHERMLMRNVFTCHQLSEKYDILKMSGKLCTRV